MDTLNSYVWYLGVGSAIYCAYKIFEVIRFRFLASPFNLAQFRSEWALITGASMGLGESFAEELAKKGLNVILVARSLDKMEKIAKNLNAKYGIKCISISADLSKDDDEMFANIGRRVEGLTISVIVANAGAGAPYMKPYWEWEKKDIEYVQNLTGTNAYRIIKMLIPSMIKRNKGAIICVSSLSARAAPLLIPYGSEKAKLNSFVELLQLELLDTNIFAQALVYGEMYTPSYVELFGSSRKESLAAPLPEVAARAGLRYFGCSKEPTITPYWVHELLGTTLLVLPLFLRKMIVSKVSKDLQRDYKKSG